MIPTKSLLSAFGLLLFTFIVTPLSATLNPHDGLFVRNTATDLGHITSTQTLLLDLVRVYRADAEITLIDRDTNQPVAQFQKTWNYGVDAANGTTGGASENSSIQVAIYNSSDYDMTVLDGIPEGNYRLTMDVLAADYSPDSQEATYGYFDNYGDFGYGYVGVDIGSEFQSSASSEVLLVSQ